MIDDKRARAARWMPIVLPVVLSLVLSSAYLTLVLRVGEGRPIAPLDDSYIFYQYARQIARGSPWQYNDGDPPSRGMTSLLYPWLLAGFYKLGFHGEKLVWVAMFGGVLWLAGIAVVTGRVWDALGLSESRPGLWRTLASVAVLLTGVVQWASFTGMETGLLMLLVLLSLEALLRRHNKRAALWLGLAGLTRPEGLILACLSWLICLVTVFVELRPGQAGKPVLWRCFGRAFTRALPLGAAILVGLVPTGLNWVMTGSTTSAGLEAKAWFYNVPRIGRDIARSMAVSYGRVFAMILNGWQDVETGGHLVAPSLTLMAIVGWLLLGARRRWIALLSTASWFWLGTLSTATLITATWHLGRYQAPFVPLAVLAAVAAMQTLWTSASQPKSPTLVGRIPPQIARFASAAMLLWLLGTSLLSTYYALSAFRQTLHTVAGQQLALADWIDEHLPQDVRVGVHDTGALRYVGQRATYDLVGLTTARATLAWRHGSGSIYEQMEHSVLRPDYFALYPDVLAIPYLTATDLFADELFAVRVDDYVVTSASPIQKVWRADWRLAGSGNGIVQTDVLERTEGLTLVDTLDVADLDDEEAHHLLWWHDAQYAGFPTEVQQLRYHAPPRGEVLDGGRLVSGGMAFQIVSEPGQPLWIVARLHARQAGAVYVTVNGESLGRWAFPALPGAWLETLFRVPAEAIVGTETQIRLELAPDVPAAWLNPTQHGQYYAPYYYWFFHRVSQLASPPVSHPLDITFDDDLHLLGFDLTEDALTPGQVLSTTLYWQTDVSTESTARVFLHLYDAQGNLGPQFDDWPVSGTRPPYTWQPGETIVDRRAIPLPADLPPGRYALQVGLYDAGGRLTPSSNSPNAGELNWAEKRVHLAYVEIGAP